MSSSIWPARGCVYLASGKGSGGLYSLDGLHTSQSHNPVLLRAVNLNDKDTVGPITTIDSKFKVIYVFGEAFGNASIKGEVLLGSVQGGGGGADSLSAVIDWFNANRLSKLKGPVNLSIKDTGYSMYVYGLVIGDSDPELNIQRFAITGLITTK